MSSEIYQDMIQPTGPAYSSDRVKPWSHYREPINDQRTGLTGNSRRWGDASPEVQSAMVDKLIAACEKERLGSRDTAYVLAVARAESGFNPDAAAGSTSAAGLGQFIDKTGRHYGLNNSNRWDPDAQAAALVEHYIDNKRLAHSRGKGEEYIYKYHHDGPTADYGGLGLAKKKVIPYLDAYERFVVSHDKNVGHRIVDTPTKAVSPRGRDEHSAILKEARLQFGGSQGEYEYGRSDMRLKNNEGSNRLTDPSRTEQDLDGDGLKGVDCSSLVWKALKNAGYDVPSQPFATSKLYEKGSFTEYSRKHFDVISASEASRSNGALAVGDIIMFEKRNGSRHVGIFSGYDASGHITFYGSQVSTGPAEVTNGTQPGGYWNGKDFKIVGALRPKEEFQVRSPLHGEADVKQERSPRQISPLGHNFDDVINSRDRGPAVVHVQQLLNAIGYAGPDGRPFQAKEGTYGPATTAAVKQFQEVHGLRATGEVDKQTLEALQKAKDQPLITSGNHPDKRLYDQIKSKCDEQGGAAKLGLGNEREYKQALATMTYEAKMAGMTSVDHVVPSTNGRTMIVMQLNPANGDQVRAVVDKQQAMQQPVEQSSAQLQQDQQRVQQVVQSNQPEPHRAPTMAQ